MNRINKKLNLLLVSSSCAYKGRYFAHCEKEIKELFSGVKKITFISYGGFDQLAYANTVSKRFKELGFKLGRVSEGKRAKDMIEKAEAIYIGGGNTFRLLFKLEKYGLLPILRQKILSGVPYLGPSAGAIVACPTIQSTGTIATLYPKSLKALNLVPFFIAPHYTPTNPKKHTTGETREERFEEFLEENDETVLALGEGSFLQIENGEVFLGGGDPAFIFKRGSGPVRYNPSTFLVFW